jgi:hypothetical protein
VVQSGAEWCNMMQENTPPTKSLVRTTISVRPEVLDAFRRLCAVSGVSLSKGIGDWLADTVEAAEAMADLVEKAREQPKMVVRQLQGYALGLSDMTNDILEELRARPSAGSTADTPPVGNTGGKLPQTPKKRRGKDA